MNPHELAAGMRGEQESVASSHSSYGWHGAAPGPQTPDASHTSEPLQNRPSSQLMSAAHWGHSGPPDCEQSSPDSKIRSSLSGHSPMPARSMHWTAPAE